MGLWAARRGCDTTPQQLPASEAGSCCRSRQDADSPAALAGAVKRSGGSGSVLTVSLPEAVVAPLTDLVARAASPGGPERQLFMPSPVFCAFGASSAVYIVNGTMGAVRVLDRPVDQVPLLRVIPNQCPHFGFEVGISFRLMMVIEFLPRVDAERIPRFCQCQFAHWTRRPTVDFRIPTLCGMVSRLFASCLLAVCDMRRCICVMCRTTSSSAWSGSPLVTRLRLGL